jgi:dipeptidase E
MTPRIGAEFVHWRDADGDETLGVVDFSIFPHLDYPGWPDNTLDSARQWATKIPGPAYAIDDQTAISVVDGAAQVHSEGHWELINAR